MQRIRRHRRRFSSPFRNTLLIVCALGLLGMIVVYRWSNIPAVQQYILRAINAHTTWQISTDGWSWDPTDSTVRINNLSLTHQLNNHYAHADSIVLEYSPWAFLRGTLKIRALQIHGMVGRFEQMPSPTTERRHISLRKLLFLRNLEITDAAVDGVKITLPHDRIITAAQITLQYHPNFLRGVRVHVESTAPTLLSGDRLLVGAQHFALSGTTDLLSWVDVAPFVNNVKGALHIDNAVWRTLQMTRVDAVAQLINSKISLDDFSATIGGHDLHGKGAVEFANQHSAAHIEWPTPITIPELLPDSSFFLSAGAVTGSIDWDGTSLEAAHLNGAMRVDLTQTHSEFTNIPAHLTSHGIWRDGILHLDDGILQVGSGRTTFGGSISPAQHRIDIGFSGEQIPLAGVLGRFRNPDFHPVDGTARARGSFKGWAHDYNFDLEAHTNPGASYQGIVVEGADLTMHLTYPKLALQGTVTQHGRTTGTVALGIAFGAMQSDDHRTAVIDLKAQITDHQLGPSFPLVGLTGVGRGTVTIRGPTTNYRGDANVELQDGTFLEIPFDNVTGKLALRPAQVSIVPVTIEVPNLPTIYFTQPLTMDIHHGFHLHGRPTTGLDVDLNYQGGVGLWTFHNISFSDPHLAHAPCVLRGSGRSPNWDLHVNGTARAEWLQFIPAVFSEAEGLLPLNLSIRGNMQHPQIDGTMTLQNNRMILRTLPQEWNGLAGVLHFHGNRIDYESTHGFIGDGPFTLTGWVEHAGFSAPRFALALRGNSLSYMSEDRTLRSELDTDVHITRADGRTTTIDGSLAITDATYTHDFRVLEHVGRTDAVATHVQLRKIAEGYDDVRLNLRVESRGDVWIRNNVATIALRVMTNVTGTAANPQVRGTIQTAEGTIHYLGLEFDVVSGTMEFHPPLIDPWIDFSGEKTVGTHLVQIILRGPTNNLRAELTAVPAEDRKNVLCLIAYGNTCDQLRTTQFGAKVGPGVFVEQIGKIVERPLYRFTGLDVVRVESAVGTNDISRLHLGKRISDRLEISFVTSVGQASAEQSFEADYRLTDFLLLKARRATNNKSQINMSLRFRER